MAKDTKKKVVTLEREKETKNTIKFAEPDDGRTVRTVYVDKEVAEELGLEDTLKVTLAAG